MPDQVSTAEAAGSANANIGGLAEKSPPYATEATPSSMQGVVVNRVKPGRRGTHPGKAALYRL